MRNKKAPRNPAEIQIPQDPLALLDIDQAQVILNCSRGSVYNMIRSGELLSIKILTSTRFRRSDLEKFIADQAEKSSSEK